ncbi:MAG TPA: N-acetylmuramoyl-L-alanine amidase [Desulfomonilaceae bacterium]|nr:N-acetylmuramoyl-L-alanine amidase [Desulfomonilaceae bacterium]
MSRSSPEILVRRERCSANDPIHWLMTKILTRAQIAAPAIVLLMFSVSASADLSPAVSYSHAINSLERLETNPATLRGEWSQAIQCLLKNPRIDRNPAIACRAMFRAGTSSLALYRRHGNTEDLDAAIRYLSTFTKIHRNGPYFIRGLKALKEADSLKRKTLQPVPHQPRLSCAPHPFENAGLSEEPVSAAKKLPSPHHIRTEKKSAASATGQGTWNRPAYKYTGNPFWMEATGGAAGIGALEVLPNRGPSSRTLPAQAATAISETNTSAPENLPPPVQETPRSPAVEPPTPIKPGEPASTQMPQKIASLGPSTAPGHASEKKPEIAGKGFVVVLDPGHGGRDPGAVSRDGSLKEKDLTLEVAKQVKVILERKHPGITVEFTRSEDTFMTLEERTAAANSLNADLFLSIHCNSDTDSSSTGMETYYLSKASSRKAMRVAARENSVSLAKMSDLQATLLDLMVTSKKTESEKLATAVNNALEEVVPRGRHRGIKQAPFYVLVGAKMPAILVEFAFISNKAESKKLHSPEYLHVIAEGLANGAHAYLLELGDKG